MTRMKRKRRTWRNAIRRRNLCMLMTRRRKMSETFQQKGRSPGRRTRPLVFWPEVKIRFLNFLIVFLLIKQHLFSVNVFIFTSANKMRKTVRSPEPGSKSPRRCSPTAPCKYYCVACVITYYFHHSHQHHHLTSPHFSCQELSTVGQVVSKNGRGDLGTAGQRSDY